MVPTPRRGARGEGPTILAGMGRRKARRRTHEKRRGAKTHSCGKILYNSWDAAQTAAILQGDKHGTLLRPYHCRDCRAYHLTSKV